MNESSEKQEPGRPGWFDPPLWRQGWIWCGVVSTTLYVPTRLLYGPGAVHAYFNMGIVFAFMGMICYQFWRRSPHKMWLFHTSGFLMGWFPIAYMLTVFLRGTTWE